MVVRGCVHGGVVICEVRVAASPVVHDRADRAVPCAPLLGGVGDAARTRCAARQRARSCRPCGRNRWSGAPLPGVPVGKPPDWIPVGGPDRAASLVRAAPGTPRSASTSLNPNVVRLGVGVGCQEVGGRRVGLVVGAGLVGVGRSAKTDPFSQTRPAVCDCAMPWRARCAGPHRTRGRSSTSTTTDSPVRRASSVVVPDRSPATDPNPRRIPAVQGLGVDPSSSPTRLKQPLDRSGSARAPRRQPDRASSELIGVLPGCGHDPHPSMDSDPPPDPGRPNPPWI